MCAAPGHVTDAVEGRGAVLCSVALPLLRWRLWRQAWETAESGTTVAFGADRADVAMGSVVGTGAGSTETCALACAQGKRNTSADDRGVVTLPEPPSWQRGREIHCHNGAGAVPGLRETANMLRGFVIGFCRSRENRIELCWSCPNPRTDGIGRHPSSLFAKPAGRVVIGS